MKKLNRFLALTLAPMIGASGVLVAQEEEPEDLEALRDLIEEFRATQEDLVEERRELANDETIPEGERGEAMRALLEEQAAEQRALGQQIRDLMKAEAAGEHADRRGPPEDQEPGAQPTSEETDHADTVRDLTEQFRDARDELLADWREHVENTPEEDRRDMYQAWRDEHADRFDELREHRQAIREAAQERAAERRPDRD